MMAGFYGKLPGKGDFLTRNLPREFITSWDDWLQTGMNESRQTLGDGWLQTYLTSPLWRFVLPAGTCGQAPYAGVLMPSMDRVGRYFPMAVFTQVPDNVAPIMIAATGGSWFQSVEDELLAALDNESIDMDQFDAALQAYAIGDIGGASEFVSMAGVNQGMHMPLDDMADIPKALLGLIGSTVSQTIGNCSVWFTLGSELVAPSMLFCHGLPGTGKYNAMLDGNWAMHGWLENGDISTGIKPTIIDVAKL